MADDLSAELDIVSFDGGVSARVAVRRPHSYRQIESLTAPYPMVPRGGGYSYAAASFGPGVASCDMRRFDRILAFDAGRGMVTVEAGATLGRLLAFLASRGCWLRQIPGYPGITVGGAIAANVHGKNPARDGTFRRCVESIRLFNRDLGWLDLSPASHPELFELTLGGFGLTGVIVQATIRVDRLLGRSVRVASRPVARLEVALDKLAEPEVSQWDFAYTWHDGSRVDSALGRGLLITGEVLEDTEPGSGVPGSYPTLPPMASQGRYPVCIWGGWRTRAINGAYLAMASAIGGTRTEPLFDATFPFARRSAYFRMYGRHGLMESQAIVPRERVRDFAARLGSEIRRHRPPIVMFSLKSIAGEASLLRFEGTGVIFALDMVRSQEADSFMSVLDQLHIEIGAIPSIIKDSRLPGPVARACYPGFERFASELARRVPVGAYRSEVSARLGL